MVTKEQVIKLYRQDPSLTAEDISRRLDCCAAYVRKTAARNGLVLASNIADKNDPRILRAEARALMLSAQRKLARAQAIEAQQHIKRYL